MDDTKATAHQSAPLRFGKTMKVKALATVLENHLTAGWTIEAGQAT
jgi:hypothetical protein